ncbi:MAG: bi-domain-containing oxidoreductase [bacterium]
MKQVFSSRVGILVEDVPAPICRENGILVRTVNSLISAGTEMMTVESSGESILRKAFNPEMVRKVADKIHSEGVLNTISLVKNRLSDKMGDLTHLGYSLSGIAIEVGKGVDNINIGDKVACAGAGYANHAEINYVPKNLAIKVPDGVSFREAAFVTLGAIAMQGVRRAQVSLGESVVVIGLGLLGQLTSQILKAAGCRVIGIDLYSERVELGLKLGMYRGFVSGPDNVEKVKGYTDGVGADAVIITAATSSSEPVNQAMKMCRRKGRVIVVGAVGMDLKREDFYSKELDFLISTSYGPGRYDPLYEEKGIDYPIGYVRWTENRNMEEFLRMVSEKKVDVESLISAEFQVEKATEAYALLQSKENRPLGVLLKYDSKGGLKGDIIERKVFLHRPRDRRKEVINVGVIGAGGFAQGFHLPNLKKIEGYNLRAVVTATPVNAKNIARKFGAEYATTDYREVLADKDIDMVLISTRHNLHAPIAIEAAEAGKDIFLEKPMAMNEKELDELAEAIRASGVHFTLGFNRRFSVLSMKAKEILGRKRYPIVMHYRVNASSIPPDHWVNDPVEGGGRIIGEVCHFIDFMYWLANSNVEDMQVKNLKSGNPLMEDKNNVVVNFKYENGSIGSLVYTTLGSKRFPKERIEIYGSSIAIVIEDFKKLSVFDRRENVFGLKRQDKGHYQELIEFLREIKGEDNQSVRLEEAREVTLITFRMAGCHNE